MHKWLPELIPELDDLIAILDQDLRAIPYLDLEEAPDGPSLIQVATKNQEASDELAVTSWDPKFWLLRGRRVSAMFIHGGMNWFGEHWANLGRWWLEVANDWNAAELEYSGNKKTRLEQLQAQEDTGAEATGGWDQQATGSVVPTGGWDRDDFGQQRDDPSEDTAEDTAIDVFVVSRMAWINLHVPEPSETPESIRSQLNRRRSASASMVLQVPNVKLWIGKDEEVDET